MEPNPTQRVFVAVDIDAATRRAAAGITSTLERALTGARVTRAGDARWVKPEAMHLTLQFLGELDEAKVGALREAVGAPLSTAAFSLAFGAIGFFPAHGRPHVVWLGVKDGMSSLTALHVELRERLLAIGIETDARPYEPHLTLARFRRPPGARVREVAAVVDLPTVPSSSIDRVTLYESRLSSEGATHIALSSGTLQNPKEASS